MQVSEKTVADASSTPAPVHDRLPQDHSFTVSCCPFCGRAGVIVDQFPRRGYSPRCSSNRERPKQEWIEIPVPALIDEEIFALAAERLEQNQPFSTRRTIEPTLLTGMLVCGECGYAYYRSSTRTSRSKLYYYRCLGSDDYRYTNGRVCQSKPIRQDYLDGVIWKKDQSHSTYVMLSAQLIKAIAIIR